MNIQPSNYPVGIPRIEQIRELVQTGLFNELEGYSNEYLQRNQEQLAGYRWIKDALHQWSRIFEYPFCYDHLQRLLKPGAKVLDAGSGVTFFPLLLSRTYDITCVDLDDYAAIYRSICQNEDTRLQFVQADLTEIPLEAGSLDAIYCISVLEHTTNHEQIIAELQRLLRPGGILLITFDIAMDNNRDGITPTGAAALIAKINQYFESGYSVDDFWQPISSTDIYTTQYALRWNEALLPWPRSTLLLQARNILRSLLYRPRYFRDRIKMTFVNLVVRKPL